MSEIRIYRLIAAAIALLALVGCSAKKQELATTGPQYVPASTIKDIMDSIVDPNADFLWNSISETVTARGVQKKMPRTEEEWTEVRRHAITLFEATNLLLIPNRHVAKQGEKADNPGIEESPESIEALINQDRPTFENRVARLREATMTTLAAIDKKDVSGLEASSLELDGACESCHVIYWYPKDSLSQQLFREAEDVNTGKSKQ